MSKHLKQIIIPLEDGKTETIDLMTPADLDSIRLNINALADRLNQIHGDVFYLPLAMYDSISKNNNTLYITHDD